MARYKVKKATADLAATLGVPEGTTVIVKKRKKNRVPFDVKPKKVGKAIKQGMKAFGF